jgi:hypothetical protein
MEVLVDSLDPFERPARLVNPTHIERIHIEVKNQEPRMAASSYPIRDRTCTTKAKEADASARAAFERPNIPQNYKAAINNPIYSI